MRIKKLALIAVAVLAAILAACILVYRMLASGRVDPLALLFLAAVISIGLPMIRANLFPSTRDCETELDFHIQRQDALIRQQIADQLGQETLARLQAAMQTPGTEALPALVDRLKNPEDPPLQFALLTTLARYHVQTGDPAAAIGSLTAALKLQPQDFVTRFNLARNYEWQGDREEALAVYRELLTPPAGLSRAMRRLVRRRMDALAAV
jgi:tetratricopeptide (TPR) repeat protein